MHHAETVYLLENHGTVGVTQPGLFLGPCSLHETHTAVVIVSTNATMGQHIGTKCRNGRLQVHATRTILRKQFLLEIEIIT